MIRVKVLVKVSDGLWLRLVIWLVLVRCRGQGTFTNWGRVGVVADLL